MSDIIKICEKHGELTKDEIFYVKSKNKLSNEIFQRCKLCKNEKCRLSYHENKSSPLIKEIKIDGCNLKCPKCKLWKSLDYYHQGAKPGRACKLCYKIDRKKRYQRSDVKEKERQYFLRNYFRRTYGITPEQYNEMLEKQNGKCAICFQHETYINHKNKKLEALSVDHCHATGKIRGLLCKVCNQTLGKFNEDISRFQSAIDYLFRSR